MKSKIIAVTVASTFAFLVACSTTDNSLNQLFAPLNFFQSSTTINADILGAVETIDNGEMALAKLAKQKSSNHDIRRLADYLYGEHHRNLQEAKRVGHRIKVTPNAQASGAVYLSKAGQRERAQLNNLSGATFDKAYVNDMVADHQAGLRVVDQAIQSTTNVQLVKFLKETRQMISHHLQKAEALQAKLNG